MSEKIGIVVEFNNGRRKVCTVRCIKCNGVGTVESVLEDSQAEKYGGLRHTKEVVNIECPFCRGLGVLVEDINYYSVIDGVRGRTYESKS